MTGNRPIFRMAIAGLLLAMVLSSSCSKARKTIIPEKKFVALLVDLHLAQSIGVDSRNFTAKFQLDSASLYNSVFNKHGVTKAMFDSTMGYYCIRPDQFQKIYNAVTARLKYMEEEIAKAEKEMENEDLVWKDTSVYVFPPLYNNRIEIDVPIQGPGTYSVSAKVKMLPHDLSLNPRMSVYYYRSDSSAEGNRIYFPEIKYTFRNGEDKNYRATERLTNAAYTRIKGYIVNYSNVDSFFARNMVVTDIKVTRKRDTPDNR